MTAKRIHSGWVILRYRDEHYIPRPCFAYVTYRDPDGPVTLTPVVKTATGKAIMHPMRGSEVIAPGTVFEAGRVFDTMKEAIAFLPRVRIK